MQAVYNIVIFTAKTKIMTLVVMSVRCKLVIDDATVEQHNGKQPTKGNDNLLWML